MNFYKICKLQLKIIYKIKYQINLIIKKIKTNKQIKWKKNEQK